MPNRAIEIHDSVLASVTMAHGRAELLFSDLYIHESQGEPGVDAGIGWFQKALLRIDNADMRGEFSEFPIDLTGGTAQIGEELFENGFRLPLAHKGHFQLRLQAMYGPESVSFTGTGAELELLGEPGPIEEFR